MVQFIDKRGRSRSSACAGSISPCPPNLSLATGWGWLPPSPLLSPGQAMLLHHLCPSPGQGFWNETLVHLQVPLILWLHLIYQVTTYLPPGVRPQRVHLFYGLGLLSRCRVSAQGCPVGHDACPREPKPEHKKGNQKEFCPQCPTGSSPAPVCLFPPAVSSKGQWVPGSAHGLHAGHHPAGMQWGHSLA